MKGALRIVGAGMFALAWAAALLFPLPAAAPVAQERYSCAWEGESTQESYASAYAALAGAGEEGVLLVRGSERGVIAPTQAYEELYSTLTQGSFAPLLAATAQGLTRIERAAVWRTFSPRLWYADEWFAWTGEGVARTQPGARFDGSTLVLFSDPPPDVQLAQLGTRTLIFRDAGTVTARDLVGTRIERIFIPAPYAFSKGVVTLDTAGGRRIVCGVPAARTLVLPDADFADEGALLACEELEALTLPFAGSAKSGEGTQFRGEFAHLFCDDGRYRVPPSLKKVTVTGGVLTAFAFYACGGLEEIVACGVAEEDVSSQAFLGADGLRVLHSPRRDVRLAGAFSQTALPCGCTLFVRSD